MLGRNSLLRGWRGPGTAAQRSCGAPSMEVLKAGLDGALGSLSCWVAALPMAQVWGWVGFMVPSNITHDFFSTLLDLAVCAPCPGSDWGCVAGTKVCYCMAVPHLVEL